MGVWIKLTVPRSGGRYDLLLERRDRSGTAYREHVRCKPGTRGARTTHAECPRSSLCSTAHSDVSSARALVRKHESHNARPERKSVWGRTGEVNCQLRDLLLALFAFPGLGPEPVSEHLHLLLESGVLR